MSITSFFDLRESPVIADRLRFTIINEVLSKIFQVTQLERGQIYQYSTKLDTPENKYLIINNWDLLFSEERPPERCKRIKRLVCWTINQIIDILKQKYHIQNSIMVEAFHHKIHIAGYGNKGTTETFYQLRFL
jgi:hypothetical protein